VYCSHVRCRQLHHVAVPVQIHSVRDAIYARSFLLVVFHRRVSTEGLCKAISAYFVHISSAIRICLGWQGNTVVSLSQCCTVIFSYHLSLLAAVMGAITTFPLLPQYPNLVINGLARQMQTAAMFPLPRSPREAAITPLPRSLGSSRASIACLEPVVQEDVDMVDFEVIPVADSKPTRYNDWYIALAFVAAFMGHR